MTITEYFKSDRQEYWLDQIEQSDWGAGKYLHQLLKTGSLKKLCGKGTRVLLLPDRDALVSFCTLAEKDDIPDTALTPWVGFVYTFPAFRGHRHAGQLLDYAAHTAKEDGAGHIHISTNASGLYEKFGYSFFALLKDLGGDDSRVYRIPLKRESADRQMSAENMWADYVRANDLKDDTYRAWAFGAAPDLLKDLTLAGIKSAAASAYDLYEISGDSLPTAGDLGVILDAQGSAVCVIRTLKAYVVPFNEVSAEHARKEGEGLRDLATWRKVHETFFTDCLASEGLTFREDMKVVCEEFEVVYRPRDEKGTA